MPLGSCSFTSCGSGLPYELRPSSFSISAPARPRTKRHNLVLVSRCGSLCQQRAGEAERGMRVHWGGGVEEHGGVRRRWRDRAEDVRWLLYTVMCVVAASFNTQVLAKADVDVALQGCMLGPMRSPSPGPPWGLGNSQFAGHSRILPGRNRLASSTGWSCPCAFPLGRASVHEPFVALSDPTAL